MSTAHWLERHAEELSAAMSSLRTDVGVLESWGQRLADVLSRGGRLLAAGNGGSAAAAQHLTSELVGRYVDERQPLSALALHAETSTMTAIVNDYGAEEVFARQVQAHGRPGDVVVLLSTSGRSRNVLRAAERAGERGLAVWAMTGRRPNPLARIADETLAVDAGTTSVIQEVHLVAVHAVCAAVDASLLGAEVLTARRDHEVPA